MKLRLGKNREAGVTMIETLMAAFILVVGSLSMVGLIVRSIATNNRNKLDSTQLMLATAIAEQINSTIIGSGQSKLFDCEGAEHLIDTQPGGAMLTSDDKIDFTQDIDDIAPVDPDDEDAVELHYQMDYALRTPCSSTGSLQGLYDVRWHVEIVGSASDTRTYILTIGAKLKDRGEGNLFFANPVSIRVLAGN